MKNTKETCFQGITLNLKKQESIINRSIYQTNKTGKKNSNF